MLSIKNSRLSGCQTAMHAAQMGDKILDTERLILRHWQPSDTEPFIQMGQDPEVMRYFPSCLSAEQSRSMIDSITAILRQNHWGLWAVELKASHEFIGFIGLHQLDSIFSFAPAVEVGWRLSKKFWGKGYATEGALAALDYAFAVLDLDKVVAFTAIDNHPSQAVMKKLQMQKVAEFIHPKLPAEHPLARHVLYQKYHP